MISIIIPTKNEGVYLPKLLDSIKIQGIKDFEIIVADADSSDNTTQIAKQHGCKVVKGGFPAKGRNEGAKASKGEILLFIDSDIILPPEFLKNALKEMKMKNLDIAGTIQKPIPLPKKYKNIKYRLIYGTANEGMKLLQYTKKPSMQVCMFIKKEIHESIGGFNEKLIFGEDSEYAKRASKKGKFRMLECDKVLISPRRFEDEGLRFFIKNIYLLMRRFCGFEVMIDNKKITYYQKDERAITAKSLE